MLTASLFVLIGDCLILMHMPEPGGIFEDWTGWGFILTRRSDSAINQTPGDRPGVHQGIEQTSSIGPHYLVSTGSKEPTITSTSA
jgi:hypothetical protein